MHFSPESGSGRQQVAEAPVVVPQGNLFTLSSAALH